MGTPKTSLVLILAVIVLSSGASGTGKSCPDTFKDGQVFKCAEIRKSVGDLGTIVVTLKGGLINVKFIAGRFYFARKFVIKLACYGASFKGRSLKAIRSKGAQLRKISSGGYADIDATGPQRLISCESSCCGKQLVIKVIKFKICKVIKKRYGRKRIRCWWIRRKVVAVGYLPCDEPCGRYPISPLVTAVQDPCPWCVCKDDPSIKAPNGDDRACKPKCDCDPRYYKCDKYTDYKCVCKKECCSNEMCKPGYVCDGYVCKPKCPRDCNPLYYKCDATTGYKCVCKKECCSNEMCKPGYVCDDYNCVTIPPPR